jgi:hypothetical protein
LTNKTKQNQVNENTSKLVRLFNQFSHNTYSNGDGATTNKLPKKRKTKMFKSIEFYITLLFYLDYSPFDSKGGKSSNKQKDDEKKRQKICGSLSQPVLLSSTTYSFGNKDDRKYSNFVKACANFLFRSAATFSTIKQQYEQ